MVEFFPGIDSVASYILSWLYLEHSPRNVSAKDMTLAFGTTANALHSVTLPAAGGDMAAACCGYAACRVTASTYRPEDSSRRNTVWVMTRVEAKTSRKIKVVRSQLKPMSAWDYQAPMLYAVSWLVPLVACTLKGTGGDECTPPILLPGHAAATCNNVGLTPT